MAWRGSIDIKERTFGALTYLLPLFYALPFGRFLFHQFPILQLIEIPLIPVAIIYSFPFAGLLIFFVLYAAVVRNQRVSHFIRFNTLQTILLNFVLFILSLIMAFFPQGMNVSLLTETLDNVIFLGTLAACIYAMIQSAMGRYAQLPTISETVNAQLPW